MAEYLSPGVYVEEYDSAPRSIEGVGTSTAGFVGLAEKGQTVGAPVLITNFSSFVKQYGGFLSEFEYGEYRFLANSVEQFFANGGTRCYISRVIPSDARKAAKTMGILTLEAANEGKWGNRIQVSLTSVTKKKVQLLAQSKEQPATYTAKNVSGFMEGDFVVAGNEYNRITKIYDNDVTFEKPFETEVIDTSLVPEKVVYLVETDITIRYNDDFEVYQGVSFNIMSPNYIVTKLSASALVNIMVAPVETPVNPVNAILGDGVNDGTISLEGGSNGTIDNVNAGTFIGKDGGPGNRTGIQSFIENDVVSMMAVPGVTIPEVMVSLVGHC